MGDASGLLSPSRALILTSISGRDVLDDPGYQW